MQWRNFPYCGYSVSDISNNMAALQKILGLSRPVLSALSVVSRAQRASLSSVLLSSQKTCINIAAPTVSSIAVMGNRHSLNLISISNFVLHLTNLLFCQCKWLCYTYFIQPISELKNTQVKTEIPVEWVSILSSVVCSVTLMSRECIFTYLLTVSKYS